MPTVELTPCKQCGTRFQRKQHWQTFCSVPCRNRWHYEQREKLLRAARDAGLAMGPHSWESFTPKEKEQS